ncbi:MAG: hypothetical protein WC781_01105 [Candidatus Pacearchaeota archaeon]|jgi:hypothetical protein
MAIVLEEQVKNAKIVENQCDYCGKPIPFGGAIYNRSIIDPKNKVPYCSELCIMISTDD